MPFYVLEDHTKNTFFPASLFFLIRLGFSLTQSSSFIFLKGITRRAQSFHLNSDDVVWDCEHGGNMDRQKGNSLRRHMSTPLLRLHNMEHRLRDLRFLLLKSRYDIRGSTMESKSQRMLFSVVRMFPFLQWLQRCISKVGKML